MQGPLYLTHGLCVYFVPHVIWWYTHIHKIHVWTQTLYHICQTPYPIWTKSTSSLLKWLTVSMYGCMIHVVTYSTDIYMYSIEYDQMIDYLFGRTTWMWHWRCLKHVTTSMLGPHCVTNLSSSAYWDPTSRGWEILLYRYLYQSLYGSILCFSRHALTIPALSGRMI